jgi:RNA polymerase II subunit A-like phosphatase
LELHDIDWNDINDEVEAAMNESDDDDDDAMSERSSARSVFSDNDDAMLDDTRSQLRFESRPESCRFNCILFTVVQILPLN